jgi:hypothetical protein
MAVKKISEFPVTTSTDVYVFGRTTSNKNVQVNLYEAVLGTNVRLGRHITNNNIVLNTDDNITDAIEEVINIIGRTATGLKSTDESISIVNDPLDNTVDITVNLGRILAPKSGIITRDYKLALNIDAEGDNNLYLTSDGKLRSDNKWKKWK